VQEQGRSRKKKRRKAAKFAFSPPRRLRGGKKPFARILSAECSCFTNFTAELTVALRNMGCLGSKEAASSGQAREGPNPVATFDCTMGTFKAEIYLDRVRGGRVIRSKEE
jgi:hypothetical protein